MALVWLRFYSLPCEFWRPKILKDIENALGSFVKFVDQMKKIRYLSYAQICVYLDISKYLPESIKLSWQDEEWIQAIDYKNIPFHCKCHEHEHLFREFSLNTPPPMPQNNTGGKYANDFEKVSNKKRMAKSNTSP